MSHYVAISYGNERKDDPTASAESIDKLGLCRAAERLPVEVTDLGGIARFFWTYDHAASIPCCYRDPHFFSVVIAAKAGDQNSAPELDSGSRSVRSITRNDGREGV